MYPFDLLNGTSFEHRETPRDQITISELLHTL